MCSVATIIRCLKQSTGTVTATSTCWPVVISQGSSFFTKTRDRTKMVLRDFAYVDLFQQTESG